MMSLIKAVSMVFFYGLPKAHKETCPAWPIMSAIGTYNYDLAKFSVPVLQPLTSYQYTVNSSFSFLKKSYYHWLFPLYCHCQF